MNKKLFNHDGHEYEVRAVLKGDTWNIAVYEGNNLKTEMSTLQDEICADAAASGVQKLLNDVMNIIESEFKSGTAFEVAVAIKKAEADEHKSKSGH